MSDVDNKKIPLIEPFKKENTSKENYSTKIIFVSHTNDNNKNKSSEHPHKGFKKKSRTGSRVYNPIYITNLKFKKCAICAKQLYETITDIPISLTDCVSYKGYFCGQHFFAVRSNKLDSLLRKNTYANNVKMNYTYYFRNIKCLNDLLNKIANKAIVVYLKNKSENKIKIIVISSQEMAVCEDIDIMNYRNDQVREILTQIFKNNSPNIIIKGIEYLVLNINYSDSDYTNYIIKDVEIRNGGGYHQSIFNKRYEIVDVLMFSPYTGRYELTRATFDNEDLIYFMDISIYRNFIKTYGNPKVKIFTKNISKYSAELLRNESILHAFGYNVNQNDNLSEASRRDILADIIDLEIMPQKSIVNLLNNFISLRPDDKYELARYKWSSDIDFVKNYRVNPQRFIIKN